MQMKRVILLICSLFLLSNIGVYAHEYVVKSVKDGCICDGPYEDIWRQGESHIVNNNELAYSTVNQGIGVGMTFIFDPIEAFSLNSDLSSEETIDLPAEILFTSGEKWELIVRKVNSANSIARVIVVQFSLYFNTTMLKKSSVIDLQSLNNADRRGYVIYRLRTTPIKSVIVAGTEITIGNGVNTASQFLSMTNALNAKLNLPQIFCYKPQPTSQTTIENPQYGDIKFSGYTYKWDDWNGKGHERENGSLTIQTRNSHYIGVHHDNNVTNISPKRKSLVKWSTRKGAINVKLPKGISIDAGDDILCWEQNGSSSDAGYRSTVLFIYKPASDTLHCLRLVKRHWSGRTLNDIHYFRTNDAAAWKQIKPRLMQELPYCGTRIN